MGRAVQVEFLLAGLTNSSGQPLASGKVYTYEAGTTTLATTYTTQTKSSTSVNPVILDAQGRASIFADGAFKFIVKDSADATQFTVDGLQFSLSESSTIYCGTSLGASNSWALAPTPNETALIEGGLYSFIANRASVSGFVNTLQVSALGYKNFKKADGTTDIAIGDMASGALYTVMYIGGAFDHFRLLKY